jgi:hypothetical protein
MLELRRLDRGEGRLSSAAGLRSCIVVSDATVRQVLSRLDVYALVRAASLDGSVQHGPAVSVVAGGHDVGAKIGHVDGAGFGVKVRVGAEGTYLSLAWDDSRHLVGVVESTYLTYARTAAALLLPPTELGARVHRVLVMGSGPLAQACALLARDLHPDAQIQLWSRTRREGRHDWRDVVDGWWDPVACTTASFDLVVTCTRADAPLPLDAVDARYVSVGGAVDGRRREVPSSLLRTACRAYADDATQAAQRCRDVDWLPAHCTVRPFSELAPAATEPDGCTLTFVCASGGYDALLASHVLGAIAVA